MLLTHGQYIESLRPNTLELSESPRGLSCSHPPATLGKQAGALSVGLMAMAAILCPNHSAALTSDTASFP